MSDSLEMLLKRVEELESQAAFQDELHDSLNTIVAKQDREILELKRQLILLTERIKEVGETIPGAGPQDETPPHY
jgi:SlyX protein